MFIFHLLFFQLGGGAVIGFQQIPEITGIRQGIQHFDPYLEARPDFFQVFRHCRRISASVRRGIGQGSQFMLIHIVHSIIGKNAGGGSHHAITFLALVHHGNILNHHPLSFFPDVLLDIRLSGPGRSISPRDGIFRGTGLHPDKFRFKLPALPRCIDLQGNRPVVPNPGPAVDFDYRLLTGGPVLLGLNPGKSGQGFLDELQALVKFILANGPVIPLVVHHDSH